jgi:hypothetical protein
MSKNVYIGATGAWSRSIYREFGRCLKAAYEDLVLAWATQDSMVYIAKPLIKYRLGTGFAQPSFQQQILLNEYVSVKTDSKRHDVNEQRLSLPRCIE